VAERLTQAAIFHDAAGRGVVARTLCVHASNRLSKVIMKMAKHEARSTKHSTISVTTTVE
jgi:hypothetical protein